MARSRSTRLAPLLATALAACVGEVGNGGLDASRDARATGDAADATAIRDSGPACTASTRWSCATDHNSRTRCNAGVIENEACDHGCLGGDAMTDSYCAPACDATDTATWTCSTDRTQRSRCVNGGQEVQTCTMGCHPEPAGTNAFCNESCAAAVAGSSPIYNCTADRSARQRCNLGVVETDPCMFGDCITQPNGVDDICPSDPTLGNADMYCPGGNCVHWWNCRVTYQYQYATSHDWDTDMHVADGTPIILPHRSRLTAVYLAGSGFQPEFTDLVSGQWMHFNHLHLNSEFGGDDHALGPVQLVSLTDTSHPDHVYPAGWVVGFSGGGTRRTGYLGTDSSGNVCTGGHSTAAHFCVVTTAAHTIEYYVPSDGMGCSTPLGWPASLWSMIHPLAPTYASCPADCTGCGAAHF